MRTPILKVHEADAEADLRGIRRHRRVLTLMPGTKEIRSKIASVKSTQKITKAMEMVAASKMRRAQERMRLARPYAASMRNVIGHLHDANPDYRHPFLVERETRAIGIVVVSTDRGLCGALNANVFKSALLLARSWQAKGATVSLCLIGTKGLAFFRRLALPIMASGHGARGSPAHRRPDRHASRSCWTPTARADSIGCSS